MYLDFAKVYFKKKDLDEAIKYQKRAIENFRSNEHNPELRASTGITCSDWLVKIENYDEAL